MALIKCHECGTEVSTEAKTCPKCGAKVKKPSSGAGTMLIIGLVAAIFLAAMTSGTGSNTSSDVETPEQKAQKEAETARYAVAAATSKLLRDTMRDPESMKFESLRVSENADTVCMEYRARNGFGGMNREFMVVADGKTSQKPNAWNKHCTGGMYDMLWAAK